MERYLTLRKLCIIPIVKLQQMPLGQGMLAEKERKYLPCNKV